MDELRQWRPRSVSRGIKLGMNMPAILGCLCLGFGVGLLAYELPVSTSKSLLTMVALVSLGVAGTLILLGRGR